MPEDNQVSSFCKLCGRDLDGVEKLTGVCVRCKAAGNREGIGSVEEAFADALSQFAPARSSLTGNRYGVASLVLGLVIVAAGLLALSVMKESRVLEWVATVCLPLALVALILGFVGLLHRGTSRTFSIIGLVIAAASILLFLNYLHSTLAGMTLTAGSRLQLFKRILIELLR